MAFNLSANDAIADEIGKRAMMRELAGNFNMQIDPTKPNTPLSLIHISEPTRPY